MQSFSSMLAENLGRKSIRSVAIGKFDGLHLGHKKLLESLGDDGAVLIIDKAISGYGRASENNVQNLARQNLKTQNLSVPHPQNLTQENQGFLTSPQDRLLRLPNAHIVEFESVAQMSGEAFIAALLESLPRLERIVVGYDFRFGRDRLCGAQDLAQICARECERKTRVALEVLIVPKVCYGEIPLHASVIKSFVRHGDIAVANAMLGWSYTIAGEVIHGQGIARDELFPTINIQAQGYVLPAHGVYATRVDGRMAVSFFGHRVSTDGAYAIESHIIDEHIAKPPAQMCIQMHKKIRENRRFDSLQELKSQIERDIAQAKAILSADLHH